MLSKCLIAAAAADSSNRLFLPGNRAPAFPQESAASSVHVAEVAAAPQIARVPVASVAGSEETGSTSWMLYAAGLAAAAAGAAARPALSALAVQQNTTEEKALPLVEMPTLTEEVPAYRPYTPPIHASRAVASRASARMAEAVEDAKDSAFGASHTSFYTDAVAKDSYETLDDVLDQKMADPELKSVLKTLFNGCGTITEALRVELVTVAEKQESVFGDVQLGVDVVADDLMWDICKTEPLIKEGASEEEPEVREMHKDGKFCICWDPLDGSSIVDNNWAVGTIIGIWGAETGILGATGRDQVASLVALYGPRTTVFVTLDDGVYEFTYGANGVDGWLCSRDRVEIQQESKIFAPANMRAAQDLPDYGKLINYWMENKYTLRYSGGLVPDICQQFTKRMGVFANPTSDKSPAKLRLAFEAAPFGLLVEKAGGKTSDGVSGASILDTKITGIDQRTPLCIGSAKEVERFNSMLGLA